MVQNTRLVLLLLVWELFGHSRTDGSSHSLPLTSIACLWLKQLLTESALHQLFDQYMHLVCRVQQMWDVHDVESSHLPCLSNVRLLNIRWLLILLSNYSEWSSSTAKPCHQLEPANVNSIVSKGSILLWHLVLWTAHSHWLLVKAVLTTALISHECNDLFVAYRSVDKKICSGTIICSRHALVAVRYAWGAIAWTSIGLDTREMPSSILQRTAVSVEWQHNKFLLSGTLCRKSFAPSAPLHKTKVASYTQIASI